MQTIVTTPPPFPNLQMNFAVRGRLLLESINVIRLVLLIFVKKKFFFLPLALFSL